MNCTAEHSALIDYSQIDSLIEAAGRRGVDEILAAFWKSTNDLGALLKAQVDAASYAEAARTAHAVKGSAANVGANLLASAAKDVESCCKAEDAGGARAALLKFDAAYTQTRSALIAHVEAAA